MTVSRLTLMRAGLTIADAARLADIPYWRMYQLATGIDPRAEEAARLQRVLDQARKRIEGAVAV